MYARQNPRLGGFFSTLVNGSVSVFEHTIPVAAAAATGGATAAVTAAASQGLSMAKGSGKKGSAAPVAQAQPAGNWLSTIPNTYLAIGAVSAIALIGALASR